MGGESFGRTGRITIDIWSDVMCPFCYLGDAYLGLALEQFPQADLVDIRYHSFLLMPELPKDAAINLDDLLVTKRGLPRTQAEAMNAQVAERGKDVGLDYRFDRATATNMRAAHELSHFALSQGRQHDMIQRLFKAYFSDGLNVGDQEVLVGLAEEIGLDPARARAALASGEFADAVESDIEQAQRFGITGVPFFVFNSKYGVSGAQPVEAFLEVLQRTWAELPDRTVTAIP